MISTIVVVVVVVVVVIITFLSCNEYFRSSSVRCPVRCDFIRL